VVKPSNTIARMDKTVKMTVTVPAWLKERLQAEAVRENRNFSNMVTHLLKRGVEKEKAA